MLLLRNADLYTPGHAGVCDLLIEGKRIARIAPDLSELIPIADQTIDLHSRKVVPGYIDAHVHITGGGGEQGPASRCPECPLTELTLNGVTTVLGLLGTDGTSRSLQNLLFKTKALAEEGISAYMLTGSYQYPSPVMTGSVIRDIALVDQVIGCKVALSDHRSSTMSVQELIRLGSDVRMGGLISCKAGVLTIHMGSGKKGLQPLMQAVQESDIPIDTFWPTHMGRTEALMQEGAAFTRLGGTMDITATGTATAEKIMKLLQQGVDIGHITMSSDAFGSQPRFDDQGHCIGLTYVSSSVLHQVICAMVKTYGISLETALMTVTVNPARMMKLAGKKGSLIIGADADLIVYDEDMAIDTVIACGQVAVSGGKAILKGRFEY